MRDADTGLDAEPAELVTAAPTELVELHADPAGLAELRTLGWWLSLSETPDDPRSPGASAALRFYFARELGLPPLAAAELSVIRGKLFVGAKLLRAVAARHGYRVLRADSSDESCTAILERRGAEVGRTTFTIDDARRAGLVKGTASAWSTHPARMLWARASKFVLEDFAPEVTLGIATDDDPAELAGS
jgi:hypothetical protein